MNYPIPDAMEMTALVGKPLYHVWLELCNAIEAQYEMECLWGNGGKKWDYEFKYLRAGKTLCGLYAKKDCVGFMIIFGKEERTKFQTERGTYPESIQKAYDEAQTYHDGKWVMFEPCDTALIKDFIRLLQIKRKPNRKRGA